MNLDIFKLPDPSGRMSKESFLVKNYNEEYDYIIKYCFDNLIGDIPFREKVFICINRLKEVPICKNDECGNKVSLRNSTLGYREYCSTKCISSDLNIKKIKEEKSLEKFGTKSPAESKVIKDKIIKTNNLRYGGNSPMSSENTREKSKETLFKNYGVDCPSKSKELLEKRINSFKLSNYKETYKKTSLERYGVEHPWMKKEIHLKCIDHFYDDYRERIIKKINPQEFTFLGFEKQITTSLLFICHRCEQEFKIFPYQFYHRNYGNISICTNCFPISKNSSISQIELFNFIKDNYNGEILIDDKKSISPFEIDITVPSLNLGFEFNGVWWHSSKFKDENYHLKKNERASLKGISLLTIWEDDWVIKKDICKSFILNKRNRL
jgi:hypothetical protein